MATYSSSGIKSEVFKVSLQYLPSLPMKHLKYDKYFMLLKKFASFSLGTQDIAWHLKRGNFPVTLLMRILAVKEMSSHSIVWKFQPPVSQFWRKRIVFIFFYYKIIFQSLPSPYFLALLFRRNFLSPFHSVQLSIEEFIWITGKKSFIKIRTIQNNAIDLERFKHASLK